MFLYTAIVALVIAADQFSKWLVVHYLKAQGSIPLIQDVLHLTYTENTGAAFSILQGRQFFLVGLTTVAMLGMAVYLYKLNQTAGNHFQKIAFALIIGGGVGNLIDRLRLGFVVDFIDFRLINFAVFNIADSFIVIGCIIMIVDLLFNQQNA